MSWASPVEARTRSDQAPERADVDVVAGGSVVDVVSCGGGGVLDVEAGGVVVTGRSPLEVVEVLDVDFDAPQPDKRNPVISNATGNDLRTSDADLGRIRQPALSSCFVRSARTSWLDRRGAGFHDNSFGPLVASAVSTAPTTNSPDVHPHHCSLPSDT